MRYRVRPPMRCTSSRGIVATSTSSSRTSAISAAACAALVPNSANSAAKPAADFGSAIALPFRCRRRLARRRGSAPLPPAAASSVNLRLLLLLAQLALERVHLALQVVEPAVDVLHLRAGGQVDRLGGAF